MSLLNHSDIFSRNHKTKEKEHQLKDGHMSAIIRKSSRSDPGNDRSFILTSVVCRLLESIIRDSIMVHLFFKQPSFNPAAWLCGRENLYAFMDE